MDDNYLVSIVVLSWNTEEETEACLNSLRKLSYKNKEVIVVDNGSTDGSKEYLAKQKDIVYIELPQNTGFTGGQIEAYKHSKGDYIALVNSDAVVAPNWIEEALSVFEKDKKVAAVGGRAYLWNKEHKAYNTQNPFYSYQIVDPNKGYAETIMAGDEAVEVNSISGAGVMIRRKAIEKVGYFDDRFFAYYEETDLFARMKRAGYKIVYNPNIHTWHKIGVSTKDKPYFYLYQMHRNRYMYCYKNFDEPYLSNFLAVYNREGRSALKRVLLGSKERDDKAKANAYIWNKRHIKRTKELREETLKVGKKYSDLLLNDASQNVSIVIPCYNYANFVGIAIESAIDQTQKPAEIIVINDGSTDNSKSVIEKYANQIHFIDKKNEGVIKTKNLGLKIAKGSWIIFLDADDILDKRYIEKCLKKARHTSSDIVYTNMRLFGSRNEKFIAKKHKMDEIRKGNYIHNSALLRTEMVRAAGGYKQEMSGGYEDWELYLSLFELGAKAEWINEELLHYRQHTTNSRNLLAKEKGIEHLQRAVDLHPKIFGKKFNLEHGLTASEIRKIKIQKYKRYIKVLWPPTWYRHSAKHIKRFHFLSKNKSHSNKLKKQLRYSTKPLKKVKIRTTLLHLKKVRKQYSNIDKEMRKK